MAPKKRRKKLQSGQPDRSIPRQNSKASDRLRRWRFRVKHSQKIRKEWEDKYKVDDLERLLIGDTGTPPLVNRMLSTAKTILPSLFFQNPKFYTRSRPGLEEPVDDRHAAIGEGLLEAVSEQDQNLERAARLALWQTLTRIGVLKIVHDPKLEPNPDAGQKKYVTDAAGNPVMDPRKVRPLMQPDPQTGQLIPAADEQGNPIPDPESLEPQILRDEDGNEILEPDEITTDQTYRFVWVDARYMLLPDEGPDARQWTWIGEEVCVPLEEAKEDPRFPKALRSQLRANERLGEEGKTYQSKEIDPAIDEETARFRYFECYDFRRKHYYAFADGQDFDDFLIDDPAPEGVEDHPYAVLCGFTPIMSPEPCPWPVPMVHSWKRPQEEYNTRRQQITEGAKRSARKVYFDDNTFADPDEARKAMQSPADMEAVKVNDVDRPPVAITDPSLPADIVRDVTFLQFDWQVVTGQSGARLADPDAETATEATFIERAANIRDVDMQRSVMMWMASAGKKMLQMIRATLNVDLWIKMRGFNDKEFQLYVEQVYGLSPELLKFLPGLKDSFRERFGQEKWQRIGREQLQFEADVVVVPGSQQPPNLDVERSQALNFLRIIGQFPQLALSRELLRWIGQKFPSVPERMYDELTALAGKMVSINANQAGRNQGSGDGAGGASGTPNVLAGLLQSGALGGSA